MINFNNVTEIRYKTGLKKRTALPVVGWMSVLENYSTIILTFSICKLIFSAFQSSLTPLVMPLVMTPLVTLVIAIGYLSIRTLWCKIHHPATAR
jgi:hypothetical protein